MIQPTPPHSVSLSLIYRSYRGRYWSAQKDDISLCPAGLQATNDHFVLNLALRTYVDRPDQCTAMSKWAIRVSNHFASTLQSMVFFTVNTFLCYTFVLNFGSLAYQQYLLVKTTAKIGENRIYWKRPKLFN